MKVEQCLNERFETQKRVIQALKALIASVLTSSSSQPVSSQSGPSQHHDDQEDLGDD